MTNFSILNELSEKIVFRAFSIKYVLEGVEHYQVNRANYPIRAREYLLANRFCEGKVEVESTQFVKGVCIDLSPELLSEVLGNYIKPDSPMPDIALDTFFNSPAFLENKYQSCHTKLGKTLDEVSQILNKNPFYQHQLGNEFYFTLAENIIEDHVSIIAQLYNIQTVKHATRKDLYKKLLRGKYFLESNLQETIHINQAAEEASLSEYHFFRLFKQTFGTTPQQYLIQIRLSRALYLLQTGNYTVAEAAHETGFADIHSFSKSFKKHFGYPPSQMFGN